MIWSYWGAPVILDNFKINKLVQADYEKNTVQYKNYIEACWEK